MEVSLWIYISPRSFSIAKNGTSHSNGALTLGPPSSTEVGWRTLWWRWLCSSLHWSMFETLPRPRWEKMIGWFFMIFVWTWRDELLSNYWVWKLPNLKHSSTVAGRFAAKFKKAATPLGGSDVAGTRAVVFQSVYSEVWFYHPTYTHAQCCVFPTESIFTLNELVSYACGLRKPQLLNDLKSPPLQSCAWLARSSDGRNSFWSHLAWWCAHQGSLEVV